MRERLSDIIEKKIIQGILSGEFPPGSSLPLERNFAAQLGIGRPTLREVIQRLERDGWLKVRKAQPTLINDFWTAGNLNILSKMVQFSNKFSKDFLVHLLELRAALTPVYIKDAIINNPAKVIAVLVESETLKNNAEEFADFDWKLQKKLAKLSKNPLYLLILNSFDAVYIDIATRYFSLKENRNASKQFYALLLKASMSSDAEKAAEITKNIMEESIKRLKKLKIKL